ncbi:12835_t:CDS:2 [Acaulospora morrowiae]|uniref:12835_t:CDS:1 n=1 Tax=Acaulospora morrowiae TaxID=94023 RepID=A0A9N9HP90_9GLOM|nr:12835_t:CDS:2 [Acaulospora morrowiae]
MYDIEYDTMNDETGPLPSHDKISKKTSDIYKPEMGRQVKIEDKPGIDASLEEPKSKFL